MFDQALAQKAAQDLKLLREKKPLVHNITNFVVMNTTANALLACGASPVMSHAPEEVEEMVSLAGALVLNIGTLTPYWIEAMVKAGKQANKLDIPVIMDPVGAGATRLRTQSAKRILEEVAVKVVRGNASEVLSLSSKNSRTRGVDSIHSVDDAAEVAEMLAGELHTTIAITGAVDLVTDGNRALRISNGHELMGLITGTGCTASALIGAFLAIDQDSVDAATTALAYFGLAGERAADTAKAPGSYQVALLDALFTIDAQTLQKGARIQHS